MKSASRSPRLHQDAPHCQAEPDEHGEPEEEGHGGEDAAFEVAARLNLHYEVQKSFPALQQNEVSPSQPHTAHSLHQDVPQAGGEPGTEQEYFADEQTGCLRRQAQQQVVGAPPTLVMLL